jgi:Flp pilus assembly protein TadG
MLSILRNCTDEINGRSAMFARLLRSIWRNNSGAALVEATLVVPVLMVLAFGVYEFSWYFYRQQLISTGLRDAARYISRMASPGDPACNPGIWPVAKNLATTARIADGGAARVNGWTAAMVTITCEEPVANVFVVKVSTSFAGGSLGFFGVLGLTAPSISVFHRERTIGQG